MKQPPQYNTVHSDTPGDASQVLIERKHIH
jgi:hypothetical protein